MPDPKKSFNYAFKKARATGSSSFKWKGNVYHTQTAEEKAVKMTNKQLDSAYMKSMKDKYSSGYNEAKNRVHESYWKEKWYREHDKNPERGIPPRPKRLGGVKTNKK